MITKEMPWTDCVYIDEDNKGYFVAVTRNALYEIDFDKNEYYYLHSLEENKVNAFRQYTKCLKWENKIIVFPVLHGNHIIIYNLRTKKISHIEDSLFAKDDTESILYFPFMFKEYVYIYSCIHRGLLVINPKNETIERVIPLSKYIKPIAEIGLNGFTYNCIEYGEECNYLIECNLYNESVSKIIIPKFIGGHVVLLNDKEILAVNNKKSIDIYNIKSERRRVIQGFPKGMGLYKPENGELKIMDYDLYPQDLFHIVKKIGKYIFFVPSRINKFLYFDIASEEVKELEIIEEEENSDTWQMDDRYWHKYLYAYVKENRFLGLYSKKNKSILEIDSETLSYKYRNIALGSRNIKQYFADDKTEIIAESNETTLEWLFELLKNI